MLRVLQYALLCDNAFPCSIDRRSSSSVAFFAAAGAMESSFLLYCSSLLSETRVCMLSLLPCMQRLRFVFSLHALARCPACSHHLSLSLSLALSLSLSLSLSLPLSPSLTPPLSLSLSLCPLCHRGYLHRLLFHHPEAHQHPPGCTTHFFSASMDRSSSSAYRRLFLLGSGFPSSSARPAGGCGL